MPAATPVANILSADEGPAFALVNATGQGPFVFVCEHASNRIPESLQGLGLGSTDLLSHIAWDPGALEVATALSAWFDSPLIAARFSRLVYDCNRPPIGRVGIAAISEDREIPGNRDLSGAEVAARIAEFYQPFATALGAVIDARSEQAQPPTLVSIHSFTPVYLGGVRKVELGILHDSDTRFADALLDQAAALTRLDVRRNQPYGPADGVTHTLQAQALRRGLWNVMFEIRNDLLTEPPAVAGIVTTLADLLQSALQNCAAAAARPAKASG